MRPAVFLILLAALSSPSAARPLVYPDRAAPPASSSLNPQAVTRSSDGARVHLDEAALLNALRRAVRSPGTVVELEPLTGEKFRFRNIRDNSITVEGERSESYVARGDSIFDSLLVNASRPHLLVFLQTGKRLIRISRCDGDHYCAFVMDVPIDHPPD